MAIAKPSFDLLLAFGLLAALSCKYDPRPPNGVQTCAGTDAGKQCPSGYECRAGKCYNTPADDGGLGLDAPQSVGGSGGNGAGGNAGAGDTMTSNPDSSAACGQLTQSCCANSQCTAGTVCNGASCVLCGASDQLCCAGNTCATAGLVCSGGSCVACGARTQPCCAGNACNSELACSANGNCVLCGALAQPCCSGDTPCRNSLVCTDKTCVQPNVDGGSATATATTYAAGIATFTAIVTNTETMTLSKTHTAGATLLRTGTNTKSQTASESATITATATATTTTGPKSDAGSDASTKTSLRTSIIIGTASAVSAGLPAMP